MRSIFGTLICSFILLFLGCSMTTTDTSFDLKLDNIDVIIKQRDVSAAEKLLKKVEKDAFNSDQRLSIIKRYLLIGKEKSAERYLKKSLQKLPNDKKILAVYANFLINKNRLQEAEKIAILLEDSEYKSFLAEIEIQTVINKKSAELVNAYKIAGDITKNPIFYRNCAVIEAMNGNYPEALKFHPKDVSVYDDSFFWAVLSYNAKDWRRCLKDILQNDLTSEASMLCADAYIKLNEIDEAKLIWHTLVQDDSFITPVLLMNSALSAELTGDIVSAQKYLTELVNRYPDYMYGLAYYGKFAYKTSIRKKDDLITAAVRQAGYKSLEMERLEKMPQIPVSDAIYRMDAFIDKYLQSSEAEKLQVYELLVEEQKLKWLIDNNNDGSKKLIDIWQLLEKCTRDGKTYPSYLVQYASWLFLSLDKIDDADKLLQGYFQMVYGDTDIAQIFPRFTNWEAEYVAYIQAVLYKNYDLARTMLEKIESTLDTANKSNLANLYFAFGFKDEALKLYSEATRYTKMDAEKSDIHYRIAEIQLSNNNFQDAELSLNFSISLNPGNSKARILLKKIK